MLSPSQLTQLCNHQAPGQGSFETAFTTLTNNPLLLTENASMLIALGCPAVQERVLSSHIGGYRDKQEHLKWCFLSEWTQRTITGPTEPTGLQSSALYHWTLSWESQTEKLHWIISREGPQSCFSSEMNGIFFCCSHSLPEVSTSLKTRWLIPKPEKNEETFWRTCHHFHYSMCRIPNTEKNLLSVSPFQAPLRECIP